MAAQSSDLDDKKSGATIQTEGHTLTPPNGQNGPKKTEASGSALSCSLSQSLARRLVPEHPETQYCLEIQVILTKDGGATPPPSTPDRHPWFHHALGWQIWPHRSGQDGLWPSHPISQKAIPRRRT